jgi:hypothetical protein
MSNNATNFREAVIENTAGVFLGQGHFEEVVSFQLTEVAPVLKIVVLETHDDGGITQEAAHKSIIRRLTVMSARNPVVVLADGSRSDWLTVTGTAYSPDMGNLFTRADGSLWTYSRVQASDFASWTLTFVSHLTIRAGARPIGM